MTKEEEGDLFDEVKVDAGANTNSDGSIDTVEYSSETLVLEAERASTNDKHGGQFIPRS